MFLLKYGAFIWTCFYVAHIVYTDLLFIKVDTVLWIGSSFAILFFSLYKTRLERPPLEAVEEFFGPIKKPDAQAQSASFSKIDVIAHRGACLDAPENSISAFRKCKECHCHAVEFDLSFTKDWVPVLFHDNTLDRITNGTGKISEITYEELEKFDIGSNTIYGEKFVGEKIPTFEQGICTCLDIGLKMFIDLKSPTYKSVSTVINMFHKYPALFKVAVVTSFYPHLIYQIRSNEPEIICCLAWRPKFFSYENYSGIKGCSRPYFSSWFKHYLAILVDVIHDWLFQNCYWDYLGLSAVLLHKDVLNMEVIQSYHRKGIHVLAWTVNIPMEKIYFNNVLQIPYFTDSLHGDKILELSQS